MFSSLTPVVERSIFWPRDGAAHAPKSHAQVTRPSHTPKSHTQVTRPSHLPRILARGTAAAINGCHCDPQAQFRASFFVVAYLQRFGLLESFSLFQQRL